MDFFLSFFVALSDVYAHSGCVAAQLDVCLVSCELVCVCVCVCVICETFPRHARQFASHVCLCVCACVGQTLLSYPWVFFRFAA